MSTIESEEYRIWASSERSATVSSDSCIESRHSLPPTVDCDEGGIHFGAVTVKEGIDKLVLSSTAVVQSVSNLIIRSGTSGGGVEGGVGEICPRLS